jgi:hypothetical protein
MPPSKASYDHPSDALSSVVREDTNEYGLISTLQHRNGFVWHTTGSGKTLTSFKASTLGYLREMPLPKMLGGELSVADFSSIQDFSTSTPQL